MQTIFLQFVILTLTGSQYASAGITRYINQHPSNIRTTAAELATNDVLPCRNLLQTSFAGANVFFEESVQNAAYPIKCIFLTLGTSFMSSSDLDAITHVINTDYEDTSNSCTEYGCFGTDQCAGINGVPNCQVALGYNLNMELGGTRIGDPLRAEESICRPTYLSTQNCIQFSCNRKIRTCSLYSAVTYVLTSYDTVSGSVIR
uniref:AlNc14C121G6691 protein n=1 Tax=Albugo laibachii Nc14 TaxID=890382 RepID=F0WJG2_9STRA|nr:AlNc14C121G6691 [Albugo laibachii Nc14]|eukprot:CCA21411.1 AlNc14C121G6691 [Albugo laibachii Nc14]